MDVVVVHEGCYPCLSTNSKCIIIDFKLRITGYWMQVSISLSIQVYPGQGQSLGQLEHVHVHYLFREVPKKERSHMHIKII